VRAPGGVRDHRPRELVVVVGAGTPIEELDRHLAAHGQRCALWGPPGATVGGAVATAHAGPCARGDGPARDAVLGLRGVDARGRVVTAGGATVKNVAGFDLCRLFTGSLGTLVVLAELTLRTQPVPEHEEWVCGPAAPAEVDRAAPDAAAVLWDGTTVWAGLRGHPADVAEARRDLARLGCGDPADGPPPLPPHRWSVGPGPDPTCRPPGPFVLEVGVGVLHTTGPAPPRPVPRRLWDLHVAVKDRFDPDSRLNPGRSPLNGAVPVP
jgi:glycolate oxidase FAD binding subunit